MSQPALSPEPLASASPSQAPYEWLGAEVTMTPGCAESILRGQCWGNASEFGGCDIAIPEYDPNQGSFRIYWGEVGQPVDAWLADETRVGVASRWPHLCHIIWDSKRLSQQPRWPNLEYELLGLPQATMIGGSAIMANTGGEEAPNDGVNTAHALDTLLTAPHPRGAGLSPTLFDVESFQAFSTLVISEHLSAGFAIRDGGTAKQAVAQVMQDAGVFMTMVGGKIRLVPIREPNAKEPIIHADMLLDPEPSTDVRVGGPVVDSMMFTFPDRLIGYRDMTVNIDEDGQAGYTQVKSQEQIRIWLTPSFSVAGAIARRRVQEELSSPERYTIKANREARLTFAGQTIRVEGIETRLRVLSVKPHPYSGEVTIEATAEVYGNQVSAFLPPPPSSGGVPPAPQVGDPVVIARDIPPPVIDTPVVHQVGGEPEIVIARIRDQEDVLGAEVHLSLDGVTYQLATTLTSIWDGGLIESAWTKGSMIEEEGPVFVAEGPEADTQAALDLSPSPEQWRLGIQVAIIGREVLFVRNIEPLGAGRYRLRGVLRARVSSVQEDHAEDAPLVLGTFNDLRPFRHPFIREGLPVWIKARPYTYGGSVELSEVTAVQLDVPAILPREPLNIRTDRIKGHENVFDASGYFDDVTIRWSYVSALHPRSPLGNQRAGEVVVTTSPPRGTFDVRITNPDEAGEILHTDIADPEDTFTVDALVSEFGDVPDEIEIEVREVAGTAEGPWSAPVTIRNIAT